MELNLPVDSLRQLALALASGSGFRATSIGGVDVPKGRNISIQVNMNESDLEGQKLPERRNAIGSGQVD